MTLATLVTKSLCRHASKSLTGLKQDKRAACVVLRCARSNFTATFKERKGLAWRTFGTAAVAAGKNEAEPWTVYDHPELYEAAFSYRKFDQEVDFIEAAGAQHGCGANSFLELGCGPATHAVMLAGRGHKVFALDNHKPMLQHAQTRAREAGVAVTCLQEDMRNFELPDGAQVDMVLLLLGTINHLQDQTEALECFRAAKQALRPGGLLLVEAQHPADLFEGPAALGDAWELPLNEECQVIMEFGTEDDEFDPFTQVVKKRVGVSVRKGDDIDLQGEGYIWQRVYPYQELLLLARVAGLKTVAEYGDMRLDVSLEDEQAYRLVLCLQKAAA